MGKWMLVCSEQIDTFVDDQMFPLESAKERWEKIKANNGPAFILEQKERKRYSLLSGFSIYPAVKKSAPYSRILCLVRDKQDERTKLLWIMKYTFFREPLPWLFKHKVVSCLTEKYYLSIERISNLTGIPEKQIRDYLYDTRIPSRIWKEAMEKNRTSMIENIRNAPDIPSEMKPILYERALLPNEDLHMLDEKKMFLMQQFCANCHIPEHLLERLDLLEQLVDQLLETNFLLTGHWNEFLRKFISQSRSGYPSEGKK